MEVSPPEQRRPLVVCGIHELPPQRNSSQISAHNPGDMFYQVPAPTPSSSAAAWMGCAWQVDSAPVPSQIDPAVGDRVSAPHTLWYNRSVLKEIAKGDSYATLMDSCMCGCGGGACIPQREYDRPRTDPLSQHELAETILFRVNGKCGYPLGDALRKRYRGLDGRDDKMFADSKTSISLRIEVRSHTSPRPICGLEYCLQWLPYGKWTRQVGADSLILPRGH